MLVNAIKNNLWVIVSYENKYIFIFVSLIWKQHIYIANIIKWKYNAFQFRKGNIIAQSKPSPRCQLAQTSGVHRSQPAPQVIIFLISNNKIAIIVSTRLIFLRTFSSWSVAKTMAITRHTKELQSFIWMHKSINE